MKLGFGACLNENVEKLVVYMYMYIRPETSALANEIKIDLILRCWL